MSEPSVSETSTGKEDTTSALFAQLILQQSNMAMMLLGKIAHPESGQVYKDVEAAKLFIDQLEMLETKTRGNLSKEESGFLKQSLMNLRLAFVEAVESGEPEKQHAESISGDKGASQPVEQATSEGGSTTAPNEDEHRKKFSKKY